MNINFTLSFTNWEGKFKQRRKLITQKQKNYLKILEKS